MIKKKISEDLLVSDQPLQVPKGFIEKPVRFRYDPVTVLGSFGAECHWARRFPAKMEGRKAAPAREGVPRR